MCRSFCFSMLLAILLALLSPDSRALDFNVTRLDDPTPNGCIAGDCSLREAVITSNQLSGADRILLPAGLYLLTIAGAGSNNAAVGDLDILDDLEIVGAGAEETVILASHANRHFNITPGVVTTIRQLRLDGGRTNNGGSILHNGQMTLEDAILSNNQATIDGGALRSASGESMVVRRVRFTGNSAAGKGGAISVGSPGLLVTDSVFEGNSADTGGAIAGYDIRVRNSTFDGNTAGGHGGAILSEPGCSCSYVGIVGSTFTDNQAGASYLGGALNVANEFEVRLSTFTGNSAGAGGAIAVNNGDFGEPYRISGSTLAGNSATLFGNAVYFTSQTSQNVVLTNNIITGGCFKGGTGTGVFSGVGNVESPGSTCGPASGNIRNVTPTQLALGSLVDNGGPTETMLPGAGSVAIGAGAGLGFGCERLDQRGFVRYDGDCDTGAVEVGAIDDVIFRNGAEFL